MFLPDRFIKGECPNCHSKDQYGDSCEVCGTTYSPTDLINPYSVVSGAAPVRQASEHYFFKLSDPRCQRFLEQWTQGIQRPSAPARSGEQDAGMVRQPGCKTGTSPAIAPYFGFPIPGTNGSKFFYVWLDAPVGYFGSFKNYATRLKAQGLRRRGRFLRPGRATEMVHFIGKDILYFHALFWPAMLQFAGYRTPNQGVRPRLSDRGRPEDVQVARHLHHRGSYLRAGPQPRVAALLLRREARPRRMEDVDLSLEDFVARVNSDLVGKYVNIASRTAAFISKHFGGRLSDAGPACCGCASSGPDLLLYASENEIAQAYENARIRQGPARDHAPGRPVQSLRRPPAPWELAKEPDARGTSAPGLLRIAQRIPHAHALPQAGSAAAAGRVEHS